MHLQPGERARVELPVEERRLRFYHPAVHGWVAEAGRFTVMIGASAADIRLTGSFNFQKA